MAAPSSRGAVHVPLLACVAWAPRAGACACCWCVRATLCLLPLNRWGCFVVAGEDHGDASGAPNGDPTYVMTKEHAAAFKKVLAPCFYPHLRASTCVTRNLSGPAVALYR